jgi:thiamine pyrophosphate-dependent acetolactate synthase large subunit-like protein
MTEAFEPNKGTTVADAILRLMEAYGIDTIFSIPGVHTIDFYQSLADRRIRHVTPGMSKALLS